MAVQQPVAEPRQVYAGGALLEHRLEPGAIDDQREPGSQLFGEERQLGQHVEADLESADDRTVRVVAGAQRFDGAVAEPMRPDIEAQSWLAMMQRGVQQRTQVCHGIAIGFRIMHA